MDLWDFEAMDWDPDDDEHGNTAHCLRRGIDERIVIQVLRGEPVEIKTKLTTAEMAIVGPDDGGTHWALVRPVLQERRLAPAGHWMES